MSRKNIAYINNDMLVWARNETPFSTIEQVELHFPTKIKAAKLALWEKGEDFPSVNEAKELAKIYKLPFACFYLSAIPEKKPKRYTDRRTYVGTIYEGVSYNLWEEIQRICGDRDTLLEYSDEDIVNFSPLPLFDTSDSLTEIVATIRHYLSLPSSFRSKSEYKSNSFNYFRTKLESVGIMVAQITGVDLEEMKGLSIYEDKYPIIAINNKDYERAKTFSLFHELAHLIRRSSSLCLIDDNERDDAEEKWCDLFAAAILMPKKEFTREAKTIFTLSKDWNVKTVLKLADKFGVSTVAVVRRLYGLQIITKTSYVTLYETIKEDFDLSIEKLVEVRKNKNIPIYFHTKFVNLHGFLMPRVVLYSHYNGKITLGETCKILNVKSCHIGSIEQAVMSK